VKNNIIEKIINAQSLYIIKYITVWSSNVKKFNYQGAGLSG